MHRGEHARALVVLSSLWLLAWPCAVRAHAPFPAPVAVLSWGDELIVGLNVGLVVRPERARPWNLTCGADASADVLGYRADPAAPKRVLALLHTDVAWSDDLGCTWQRSPAGGELIDAGFASGDRIWTLSFDAELYQVVFHIWHRAEPALRSSLALPQGLEIGSGMISGDGDDQRIVVTGYDAANGDAYVLDAALQAGAWSQRTVTSGTFELPKLVYAARDSRALALRLMGSDDERLALTSDGETFELSPLLGGYVRAFFDAGRDGLLVAVRSGEAEDLIRLDRQGVPNGSAMAPFATRAIVGRAERLFALSYELGSAPLVLESIDLGASWSPLLRMDEIHEQSVCEPAPIECAQGCLQLAAEGLISLDNCSAGQEIEPSEPLPESSPDAGSARQRAASCSAALPRQAGMPALLALWGLLWAAATNRRRR